MLGVDSDYLFKVVVLGNSGAGKSSLLLRFADNFFSTDFIATIGVDFKIRKVDVDGKSVKLQMWDTAGQDRFRDIVRSYYRGASGIVLVYDIADRQSFDAIPQWMNDIQGSISGGVSYSLVGNKSDLENKRAVPKDEAEHFARQFGIPFTETSAKDAIQVDEVFVQLASAMKARAGLPMADVPHVDSVRRLTPGSAIDKARLCC
jgi:Ras-related protein Rab-1A